MSSTTAPNASTTPKVWLITGCSSGFGRQIAIDARNRGDIVIATSRKIETLEPLRAIGCDALALDVSADEDTVKRVVDQAHALHGRIDVLVNNAGISAIASIEAADDSEALKVFNTNVFGLLRVTRAVLPYMRAQKSGTIGNIGSVTGRVVFPNYGIYAASKFAVAALSATLKVEVAPLNIDVVVIEPGLFNTEIVSSNLRVAEEKVDVYAATTNAIVSYAKTSETFGDPVKGAQFMVDALTKTGRAANRELPTRLPLGEVFDSAKATLENDLKELEAWKDFTDMSLLKPDQ